MVNVNLDQGNVGSYTRKILPSSAKPQLVASFSFAGQAELALFSTNAALIYSSYSPACTC